MTEGVRSRSIARGEACGRRRTCDGLAMPSGEGGRDMGMVVRVMIAAVAAGVPMQAGAAPHCMAHPLADVPAMEAPEEVRSKANGAFGPVTQIKVDKKTGRMFYCAKNTYCYDSNAFELQAPCRIKLDKDYGFGADFVYFTR